MEYLRLIFYDNLIKKFYKININIYFVYKLNI